MWVLLALLSLAVATVKGVPLARHARLIGRETASNSSYDFVILGGGTSGLTVADRLTENPKTSVLVIEYGYLDGDPGVIVPGLWNNTRYMFNLTSVPQVGLLNGTYSVPAAAVVGGGTTVNGMFFDRGSAPDYDAWSENFTPAAEAFAEEFDISWDEAVHGFGGPVQSSYPVFQFPPIKNFIRGWHSLGVTTPKDPGSGDANGVFWAPSSLDPKDETRSYARPAHFDRVASSRPNYHLLTGHVVSKIILDGKRATGFQFISRETEETSTVHARHEVVLAAGSTHTPQILQLSGLGPKGFLQTLGITTVEDLPGVGENFQDQPTLYASYEVKSNLFPNPGLLFTNETYAAEQLALYYASRQGAYTTTKNSGNTVAFLPLRDVTAGYQSIIDLGQSQSLMAHYPATTDRSVLAGYAAQRKLVLGLYGSTATSVQETAYNGGSEIPITPLKPLRRGRVRINSTDPLAPPLIDWGALTDPVDVEILVAAVRKNRELVATSAMSELGPSELAPGANVTTDDQLRAALRQQVQPTYSHLCSTCSMMKREYGGVVGPDLRVYGIGGLSVVDASIMPLILATHMSATVYAVAEKAADLIKARSHL